MASNDTAENPTSNGAVSENSSSAETSATKKDASPANFSKEPRSEARDESKDYIKVEWDGEDDPQSPKNMKHSRKWVVVILVSAASSLTTCTSSMYTLTYAQITEEFHISTVVATLGLSLYVAGLGVGPMFIAPLSEFYGRRPIYFFSFIFFIIFLIPCAVAKNTATMMMGRFLDGVAGSAFLSVAGGSVGDMFIRTELQKPMMIFSASPFVGPPVGPIIAGFINQYTNWRWTFYVVIIWSVVMLLLLMAFVPETYSPVLLKYKAARLRKETGDDRYRASIEMMKKSIARTVLTSTYRPFQLLIYEPMVLNLCLYSALLLGLLYLFFGAFEVVFTTNHHFNLWQVGMSFTGLLAGLIIAVCTDSYWHKKYLQLVQRREQETGEKGGSEPEFRLPSAILGGILVPIGLFWFGWTTYSSILWIVPIIGSAVFSCGMLFVFSGVFTFLVESYPLYAASALAANSFARSSFAAAFPLFGVQSKSFLQIQGLVSRLTLW